MKSTVTYITALNKLDEYTRKLC